MPRILVFLFCFSALGGKSLFCQAAEGTAQAKPLPKFATVVSLVELYFKKQEYHQPGDLIVRSEVQQVLRYLKKLHWHVDDADEILNRVHDDAGFLAKTLRSKNGRPFMREVARSPGGYDRLERLSHLPRGRQIIAHLAREKGGHKMIAYLAEDAGGKNLGRMLAKAPGGKDFNRPTDMLYTQADLIERLKKSYDRQAARED